MVKAFLLRSGSRLWYPFSPLLFTIVLEVLDGALRENKEIQKGVQIEKEEVNVFPFATVKENSKEFTRTLLELTNLAKMHDTRQIFQN